MKNNGTWFDCITPSEYKGICQECQDTEPAPLRYHCGRWVCDGCFDDILDAEGFDLENAPEINEVER